MLTDLNPCYEFTDGPAFVVDEWKTIKDGTKIRVYIPSLMTEIKKSTKTEEIVDSIGSMYQIFLNPGTGPSLSTCVTKLNYITATISKDLVIDKANNELYDKYMKDPENAEYITHIPRSSKLKPGDKVSVASDLGSLKDICVY